MLSPWQDGEHLRLKSPQVTLCPLPNSTQQLEHKREREGVLNRPRISLKGQGLNRKWLSYSRGRGLKAKLSAC